MCGWVDVNVCFIRMRVSAKCGCLPVSACVCVNSLCVIRRYVHGEEQRQVEACGCDVPGEGILGWVKAQLGPLAYCPLLSSLTQLHVASPETNFPGGQCRGFDFSLTLVPQVAEGLSLPSSLVRCLLVTPTLRLVSLPLGSRCQSQRWELTQTLSLRCFIWFPKVSSASPDPSIPWQPGS